MEYNKNNLEPEVIRKGDADQNGKKNNVCSIISFIFAIIGIFIAGLPCGITATILGIVGITTFKPETEKGRAFGIAGLSIGIIEIIIMILYAFMAQQ